MLLISIQHLLLFNIDNPVPILTVSYFNTTSVIVQCIYFIYKRLYATHFNTTSVIVQFSSPAMKITLAIFQYNICYCSIIFYHKQYLQHQPYFNTTSVIVQYALRFIIIPIFSISIQHLLLFNSPGVVTVIF